MSQTVASTACACRHQENALRNTRAKRCFMAFSFVKKSHSRQAFSFGVLRADGNDNWKGYHAESLLDCELFLVRGSVMTDKRIKKGGKKRAPLCPRSFGPMPEGQKPRIYCRPLRAQMEVVP